MTVSKTTQQASDLLRKAAELQKENAELRKALNWAMRDIRRPSRIRGQNDSHCDAYEKAVALSKEKAK